MAEINVVVRTTSYDTELVAFAFESVDDALLFASECEETDTAVPSGDHAYQVIQSVEAFARGCDPIAIAHGYLDASTNDVDGFVGAISAILDEDPDGREWTGDAKVLVHRIRQVLSVPIMEGERDRDS